MCSMWRNASTSQSTFRFTTFLLLILVLHQRVEVVHLQPSLLLARVAQVMVWLEVTSLQRGMEMSWQEPRPAVGLTFSSWPAEGSRWRLVASSTHTPPPGSSNHDGGPALSQRVDPLLQTVWVELRTGGSAAPQMFWAPLV